MTPQSNWRFYPWAIALGMSVVVAVNMGMVTAAFRTFPGKAAGGEGFDLSNRYNAVIDRVQEQAALGVTITAETERGGHPVLILNDRAGAPLNRVKISAIAQRPVGEAHTTEVAFNQTTPGRFVGDIALPLPGQWEVLFTATVDGHDITSTRRVIVK